MSKRQVEVDPGALFALFGAFGAELDAMSEKLQGLGDDGRRSLPPDVAEWHRLTGRMIVQYDMQRYGRESVAAEALAAAARRIESAIEIDVRYEPDHEAPTMQDGRPMLTWGHHPVHGNGWTLWYLDDPDSPTAGVEEYFVGGDVADVDAAITSAKRWLAMVRSITEVSDGVSGGESQ